jgi:hypothetical protein
MELLLFELLPAEPDDDAWLLPPEPPPPLLLLIFDCCFDFSCWRHLARRFLNQTFCFKIYNFV